MFRICLWLTCLCFPLKILAVNFSSLSGLVVDDRTRAPLSSVSVCLDDCRIRTITDGSGTFMLRDIPPGNYELRLELSGYRPVTMPLELTPNKALKLGVVTMESKVNPGDETDELSDTGLVFAEGDMIADFTPLSALREPYEKRIAFNFSQAFYRYRGYDSRYREVLINGIPVNSLDNGRAPFGLWGGLNDMFRNREFATGLGSFAMGRGSVGGSLQFVLDPDLNRRGLRVSSSASNRGYGGRLMATYNSGNLPGRFSYSFSVSRRWAEQGYVEGTLYDALSFYAAARYRLGSKESLVLNALYAPQRRGSRSALTREVAQLAGHRYNPFWGYQGGTRRNSRVKRNNTPLLLLNYQHRSVKTDWDLGLMYSFGKRSSGRLGYFNAPNPDPAYYRYLPSFQLNSGIVNYENARLVRARFMEDPQLNWVEMYRINHSGNPDGRASYVLYDDVSSGYRFGVNAHVLFRLKNRGELRLGVYGQQVAGDHFALLRDLLGAQYHLDEDPFSETANQLNGQDRVYEGDRFNYNYRLTSQNARSYVRYRHSFKKGQAYLTLAGDYLQTIREGLFRNERYPETSFGGGDPVRVWGTSVKAGGSYRFNGRHILFADGAFINRIPPLTAIFADPRENHSTVMDPRPEKVVGGDLRYRMDLRSLRLRSTLFYTEFSEVNKVSYYYLDGGVGNAFVKEMRTGVDSRHLGAELSLEYDLSSSVKADLVVAYGDYRYTSDPDITLNFNTVNEEEVIDETGALDLGKATMKDLYVSNGPQSAVSVGIEYRSPDYWWVGAVASYLDRNFTGASGVRRTASFFTDPDTGELFEDLDMELAGSLLQQERLQPIYYLDLTAGKSWLFNSVYVSLFLSVNNLFNAIYETGGYEQHRTANYRDLYRDSLSGDPSFGNKYWYGSGRTFFINLAITI
ncbi:carboxypeptidase-like regulatory domain-containing protein [Robertkochia sediminum]|uniref:carboxypeptidase-like regulatory domain-containing protein n=1 Tax=Robertkochia sediminum TaxID=2785326 RepID=UPI001933AD30|nr:carboxypeptidase-like regulatory domain-containing protein [Robertkochia sediminum]MBL7471935.1 TonB-dependent receptor [Robertkochia sediminum]